jgi:hypothetical protein
MSGSGSTIANPEEYRIRPRRQNGAGRSHKPLSLATHNLKMMGKIASLPVLALGRGMVYQLFGFRLGAVELFLLPTTFLLPSALGCVLAFLGAGALAPATSGVCEGPEAFKSSASTSRAAWCQCRSSAP